MLEVGENEGVEYQKVPTVTEQLLNVAKQSPRILFLDPNGKNVCSVYKSILSSKNNSRIEDLKDIPTLESWAIFLVSGGRFAGAIFNKKDVIIHKTFQRYTVRAGQGGAQGLRDGQNAQKAPKSAGAGLRRYNEAALAKDIRDLLTEWRSELNKTQRIFMRLSTYHKPIFFGGDRPLFVKNDERIRTVPFPTNRPSFDEAKLVHKRLTTIYSHGPLEDFLKLFESSQPSKPKQSNAGKNNTSVQTPIASNLEDSETLEEEEQLQRKSNSKTKPKLGSADIHEEAELIDSQADCLLSITATKRQEIYTACKLRHVEKLQKLMSDIPELERNFFLNQRTGPTEDTLMHRVAADGNKEILRVLLDIGASPLLRNRDGKLAFQVGKDRPTRQVMMRFRVEREGMWDWDQAQVPRPLSAEEETERELRQAEKNRILKQAKKERQKVKKAEESVKRQEEMEKNRFLSLSDREKRALAAERRLLNNSEARVETLSRCFQCACDISGKIPFEYSNNRFCSTNCVKTHRSVPNPT